MVGEDPRRVTATPTALVFAHAGLAIAELPLPAALRARGTPRLWPLA